MNYDIVYIFFVFVHILHTYDMVRNVRSWGHDQLLGVEGLGKWHARAWQPLDWWFGLRWCNVVHVPEEMGLYTCWALRSFSGENRSRNHALQTEATHDWNVFPWFDKAFIMNRSDCFLYGAIVIKGSVQQSWDGCNQQTREFHKPMPLLGLPFRRGDLADIQGLPWEQPKWPTLYVRGNLMGTLKKVGDSPTIFWEILTPRSVFRMPCKIQSGQCTTC